jgi:hypothetical protein
MNGQVESSNARLDESMEKKRRTRRSGGGGSGDEYLVPMSNRPMHDLTSRDTLQQQQQ